MPIQQRTNPVRAAQKRQVRYFRQSPMSRRHWDKRSSPVDPIATSFGESRIAGWGIKFCPFLRSPMCDQQTSIQPGTVASRRLLTE